MTQEDKQLLLTDLCGRLPYGVKCQNTDTNDESFVRNGKLLEIKDIGADAKGTTFLFFNEHVPCYSDITEIKPYLRPMSSMTKDEKDEMFGICTLSDCSVNSDWESVGVEIMSSHPRYGDYYSTDYKVIDWLNKNMFDYRGLISKELAIEAPEGMYN